MRDYELSHEHEECGDCSDCIAERFEIREQVLERAKDRAGKDKELKNHEGK